MGMEIISLSEDVQKEIEAAAADFYGKRSAEDEFFGRVYDSVNAYKTALGETNTLQFPYYR
jgi:TRAP-type mannitol/chloroaromatic compound transport system substrate-binding protein